MGEKGKTGSQSTSAGDVVFDDDITTVSESPSGSTTGGTTVGPTVTTDDPPAEQGEKGQSG